MLLAASTPFSEPSPDKVAAELDSAIVEQCRSGNREALERFVRCYERRVFAYLSRSLGCRISVDDWAQEVFVRAYQALPKFDPQGSARMSTWLITIAYHVVVDARRRQKSRPELLSSNFDVVATDNPEQLFWLQELNTALAEAAAELPVEQRDVFILADYYDLTLEEIAQVTGIGVATVKTRLFRARERLRHLLASLWETTR